MEIIPLLLGEWIYYKAEIDVHTYDEIRYFFYKDKLRTVIVWFIRGDQPNHLSLFPISLSENIFEIVYVIVVSRCPDDFDQYRNFSMNDAAKSSN